MRAPVPLAVLLVTLVAGCGSGDGGGDAVVVSDGLAVVDAWVRPTPAGVNEAAIYITIENRDAPQDRLIAMSSDRCMVMTPHLTVISDEIASMTEAVADEDQLALEVGGGVEMKPNGLHVMCLGLADPFELGDRFDVVLQFSDHDPVRTPVVVADR